MRSRIEKILLCISFAIDEFVNQGRYFYMQDTLKTTRKILELKLENKTRGSSERLEKFIVGVHDRDKRIRVFNHFKQLRRHGNRRDSKRYSV